MSAEAQWALIAALEQRRKIVAEDVVNRIKTHIGTSPAVLFMKGTPDFPQCGFSAQTVAALRASGAGFHAVNIFEDPELRDALKKFSNWPTYPQLYVNGELVGGCDIVLDMHRSGELKKLLTEAGRDCQACRPASEIAAEAAASVSCPSGPHAASRASHSACARTSALRHTPSSALHTSQKTSAVRSASYLAECASLESQSTPQTCAALASTVWPNAAPASVAVSKHENG